MHKIGIFDSGVGGLTVVKAVRAMAPAAEIVYFGDTARVPYGEKSADAVRKYSVDNADFLMGQGVDLIVVACNTATAFALEHLQERLPIPVIGVVEPGARNAVVVTQNGRIGVIGTRGTIASGIYEREILSISPKMTIFPKACPLFVPLVEEGLIDHPATRLLIAEYLQPLLEQGIDTLLLGCTHYPLLTTVIQEFCGSSVRIVDSAQSCAEAVHLELPGGVLQAGASRYFVSDDPEKFRKLGEQLLGLDVNVEKLV